MKLEIKDNQIFVDGKYDGFFSPSDKVVAELARRVNGWEGLVAFVKRIADDVCVCKRVKGCCMICHARAALREVGE